MEIKLKPNTKDIATLIISSVDAIALKEELNPHMSVLGVSGDYADPETAALYYHIFAKEKDLEMQFDCIEMIKTELDFVGITGKYSDSLNFELADFIHSPEYQAWNNEIIEDTKTK